jgi:hypothetical protein
MNLPTHKQCQDFLASINTNRKKVGFEPLDYINFDDAEPGSSISCLSAINLYYPAGYTVGASTIGPNVDAIPGLRTNIPQAIKRVTDYFDRIGIYGGGCHNYHELLAKLRERMVEAGVVKP